MVGQGCKHRRALRRASLSTAWAEKQMQTSEVSGSSSASTAEPDCRCLESTPSVDSNMLRGQSESSTRDSSRRPSVQSTISTDSDMALRSSVDSWDAIYASMFNPLQEQLVVRNTFLDIDFPKEETMQRLRSVSDSHVRYDEEEQHSVRRVSSEPLLCPATRKGANPQRTQKIQAEFRRHESPSQGRASLLPKQTDVCLVVRNTFISVDEPKVERRRSCTDPAAFECVSECSLTTCSSSIDVCSAEDGGVEAVEVSRMSSTEPSLPIEVSSSSSLYSGEVEISDSASVDVWSMADHEAEHSSSEDVWSMEERALYASGFFVRNTFLEVGVQRSERTLRRNTV